MRERSNLVTGGDEMTDEYMAAVDGDEAVGVVLLSPVKTIPIY